MINVYRFYLGRSWVVSGQAHDLLGLFDGIPEFLHSASVLPEGPEAEAGAGATTSRAALKVAMTHAHVVVLRDVGNDPAVEWTEQEISIARTGFRWRIPIIAVQAQAAAPSLSSLRRAADRIVGWNGVEIARAVKEVAEEASNLHRTEFERITPQSFGPSLTLPRIEHGAEGNERRALPTAEIWAAFNRLKAARDGSQTGSM